MKGCQSGCQGSTCRDGKLHEYSSLKTLQRSRPLIPSQGFDKCNPHPFPVVSQQAWFGRGEHKASSPLLTDHKVPHGYQWNCKRYFFSPHIKHLVNLHSNPSLYLAWVHLRFVSQGKPDQSKNSWTSMY